MWYGSRLATASDCDMVNDWWVYKFVTWLVTYDRLGSWLGLMAYDCLRMLLGSLFLWWDGDSIRLWWLLEKATWYVSWLAPVNSGGLLITRSMVKWISYNLSGWEQCSWLVMGLVDNGDGGDECLQEGLLDKIRDSLGSILIELLKLYTRLQV